MLKKIPAVWGFRFFLNSGKISSLILKILLLIIIPYAYLMLCGLVFDKLLRWYFMTNFIFISLVILFLIALILIIWAVIRYVNKKGRVM